MRQRQFSQEFKLEAGQLIKERGVSMVQASRDLDIGKNIPRRWIKGLTTDPGQAFPGQGQVKLEQQEIDRLRREVAKLRAERYILKSWTKEPERFRLNPLHHTLGSYTCSTKSSGSTTRGDATRPSRISALWSS